MEWCDLTVNTSRPPKAQVLSSYNFAPSHGTSQRDTPPDILQLGVIMTVIKNIYFVHKSDINVSTGGAAPRGVLTLTTGSHVF